MSAQPLWTSCSGPLWIFLRNWLQHGQICLAQPSLFVPYRDSVFFFEYIRKIRSLRTRLVTLNCILSHRDRGRSSRERGLQASPRPFLGLFLGFSFSYLLFPLPVRRVDRGPAPRYIERRTFCFRFILAAQLPATASDVLYSSTSPFSSLRFFCLLLSSTQIC